MAKILNVTVTDDGSLAKDINKKVGQVIKASEDGLKAVGSEFIHNLQTHIREDWYEPWGKPKQYQRRTDNNSLGTPLGSKENMSAPVRGLTLEFTYSPTGEHSNSKWHTKDGDAIINVIQKNSGWSFIPQKDTKGREIMPRPFWDNFVKEEKAWRAFDAFRNGFTTSKKLDEYQFLVEGGKNDIVFDDNDGALSASFSTFDNSYDSDIEELNF